MSLAVATVVLWQLRALRPIQDDYDMALYALEGPLGGTILRWSDWSGDLWINFINVVLVGLPLVHLPLSGGSLVAFFVTGVTAVTPVLVVLAARQSRTTLARYALLAPPLLVAFWGWWWINASADWHAYAESDALTTTFWQNVNATYIIAPLLLVAAWLFVNSRTADRARLLSFGLVGLALGMTGPVFASSSILTLTIIFAAIWAQSPEYLQVRKVGWVVSAIATAFGLVMSLLAPGSQSRSKTFSVPEITLETLQQQVWWTASTAESWLLGVASPGSLVVFTFILFSTALCNISLSLTEIRFVSWVAASLLFLSFVVAVINSLSEFVIYKGYWHLHSSRAVGWVAIALLAVALGSWVGRMWHSPGSKPLMFFGATVLLLVISAANFSLVETALLRLPKWNTGPAPIAAINDIEDPFVRPLARRFWLEIGGPERGLEERYPNEQGS